MKKSLKKEGISIKQTTILCLGTLFLQSDGMGHGTSFLTPLTCKKYTLFDYNWYDSPLKWWHQTFMNLDRILCKICILLSSSNSPSLKTLEMCLAITEQSFCVCYCINKNSSSEPQNFRLSENEILALPFRTEDKRINSFSKRPHCF